MKKYEVVLTGKNFIIKEDELRRIGFYTTRVVEATSVEEAKNVALSKIRNDNRLIEIVNNDESDPPMLFINELKELESSSESKDTGYSFYKEKN